MTRIERELQVLVGATITGAECWRESGMDSHDTPGLLVTLKDGRKMLVAARSDYEGNDGGALVIAAL